MDVDSGIETMEVDDSETRYDVKRRRVNRDYVWRGKCSSKKIIE